MKNDLYDSMGYQVKILLSDTFNPQKLGENDDTRDLGVFVTYIGAVHPAHKDATYIYENDRYVISRLDPQAGSVWNPNAIFGFYGFETTGTWTGPYNTVNIKDKGIGESGLRISFNVPYQMLNRKAVLSIYVNDDLLKEIPLVEEGEQTVVIDTGLAGTEQKQYLENAQRILKILLKDFDRVCRKYNLKYYLICGSLLGAVRNQDLIPWDDDVDVAMPRKDFDRLMKHVQEEWGKDKDIQFVNYDQLGKNVFLDFMTRIVYMKEEIPIGIYRKICGKGRSDITNHMPMDIYVLDDASDIKWLHWFQTNLITGLYGLAIGHRAYVNPDDYTNRDKKTQNIVRFLSAAGRLIPLSIIFKLYELVRKMFKNSRGESFYESNGFIYCIPWKFRKEWFGKGMYVKLGDLTVKAPREYKEFLNMHYKDFMQLPPMEVRKPTHSIHSSGIF